MSVANTQTEQPSTQTDDTSNDVIDIFSNDDDLSSMNTTEKDIIDSFSFGDDITKGDDDEEEPIKKEEVKATKEPEPTSKEFEDVTESKSIEEEVNLNPNDLLDIDGKVLAKAGKDRRIFEKGIQFATKIVSQQQLQTKEKIIAMENQIKTYEQVNSLPKELGLEPQEQLVAHKLMAEWKKNPVEVVKTLLTEVQSKGYNIEGLHGTDVAAIKQMLQNEISSIKAQQQQLQNTNAKAANIASKVETEYRNFVTNYPDAVIHVDTIGKIMQGDKNLTPQDAMYKLRDYCNKNGLDWSKDIQTQINARTAINPTPQQNTKQLPSTGNNITAVTVNEKAYAEQDESYASIIKREMQRVKHK